LLTGGTKGIQGVCQAFSNQALEWKQAASDTGISYRSFHPHGQAPHPHGQEPHPHGQAPQLPVLDWLIERTCSVRTWLPERDTKGLYDLGGELNLPAGIGFAARGGYWFCGTKREWCHKGSDVAMEKAWAWCRCQTWLQIPSQSAPWIGTGIDSTLSSGTHFCVCGFHTCLLAPSACMPSCVHVRARPLEH
jgi:hypothetical protein